MKSSKPNKAAFSIPVRTYVIGAIIVAGIVTLATLKDRMRRPTPAESSASAASTNAVTPQTQTKADFQKLTGKWLRPDGGYVMEIKSVAGTGKLEAGYFNPRPIHVAKAEATQEGNVLKVFIELQDVNYPGSTYTLTYIPERDLLVGVYFQAVQRQNFEVYFERSK